MQIFIQNEKEKNNIIDFLKADKYYKHRKFQNDSILTFVN